MKTLYLIGGTMGVGKTTVCRELQKSLPNCVFLDGDWCWDMKPFVVNEETRELVLDNICCLLRFTLPSIVMMIFTSIYGVVDGIFVSNFAGKTAFAAINLIMPYLMVFGTLGLMIYFLVRNRKKYHYA